MVVQPNVQSPFGSPTPQAKNYSHLLEEMRFDQELETTRLASESEKRSQLFDTLHTQWQEGVIKDNDYLGGVGELANESFSPQERQQFLTYQGVGQKQILKKKLDVEFDRIQKKAYDGSDAVTIYNDMIQLSTQAAMAGLEDISARYSLQASILRNQLTEKPKKTGTEKLSSADLKNSILNNIFGAGR